MSSPLGSIDLSLALLLILQILAVAGLLVTLLWLVIYRTREPAFLDQMKTDLVSFQNLSDANVISPTIWQPPADASPELSSSTGSPASPEQGTTPAPTAAAPERIDEGGGAAAPKEAPTGTAEMQGESAANNEMVMLAQGQVAELQEKVQYLEGKLLEYEIVQDEISSLSQLKVDNENLMQEIFKLQQSLAWAKGPDKGGENRGDGGGPTSAKPPGSDTPIEPTGKQFSSEPVDMGGIKPEGKTEDAATSQVQAILQKLDQLT